MMKNTSVTRLDFFRELDKRDCLSKDYKKELTRLELGAVGEQTVLRFIEEFGENHWKVIPNAWFNLFGLFECDLILLTWAGLYTFEIKNYSGIYEFKGNQCIQNGRKIGHHPIHQSQKSFIHFENVMKQKELNFTIQGALIFTGEHCEVKIYDEVEGLKVVRLNQLRNYIKDIAKEEKGYIKHRINIQKVTRVINELKVQSPYQPEPITAEMEKRMRKGILCSGCGSFDMDTRKSILSCYCGMNEPRENAIVRTICEYGVIHFDKDLRTTRVLEFFNGQISRANLLKYLKKHFNRLGSDRLTTFENINSPFEDIYPMMELKKRRYYYLDHY